MHHIKAYSAPCVQEQCPDLLRSYLLANRIKAIISNQQPLFLAKLDENMEATAQRYAALLLKAQSLSKEEAPDDTEPEYASIDVNSINVYRPRSIGVEHVSLSIFKQLKLDQKLESLGFSRLEQNAVIGTIIARMAAPGSDRRSHEWL